MILVKPNTSDVNKEVKENLDKLIRERRKTAAHCLNLECKNEQLKILIDKLHNIADLRAGFIHKTTNPITPSKEADYPYFENSSILEELKSAKENSKSLENTISELKNRIFKIDETLSQ